MPANPASIHVDEKAVTPAPFTTKEWAAIAPSVRNACFFSATVEDENLLHALKQFCQRAIDEGWTQQRFVNDVRTWTRETQSSLGVTYDEELKERMADMTPEERASYENDVRNIDSLARIKLIYRTQMEMASGYQIFLEACRPERLRAYPAWRFYRRPGAKTFRADHELHRDEVRLVTDTEYWLARNDPSFGGFGNPYPPFGFNSWMWVAPVPVAECIRLGLVSPGQSVGVQGLESWGVGRFVLDNVGSRSVRALQQDRISTILSKLAAAGINAHVDRATGLLQMDEDEFDDFEDEDEEDDDDFAF